jgi:hypothetical protein
MNKFFGNLVDEGDIAFHFGFEGCAGYGEFLAQLEPYEILYAVQEDFTDVMPGAKPFFMVLRDKESGELFIVQSFSDRVSPENFAPQPTTVRQLRYMAGPIGPMAPPGFVEFVSATFVTEEEAIQIQLEALLNSLGTNQPTGCQSAAY